MTQKETFLCHLDGHHEVLVVLKVLKGLVKVCHGYFKVEFDSQGLLDQWLSLQESHETGLAHTKRLILILELSLHNYTITN